jgi:hypothetical protein
VRWGGLNCFLDALLEFKESCQLYLGSPLAQWYVSVH